MNIMNKFIRAFVAIPLPEEIKNRLADLQSQLKRSEANAKIKWVEKDNFHITVVFLGEVFQEKLTKIRDFLVERKRELSSVELLVRGVRYFGRESSPRVIWSCLYGELDQFARLSSEIKDFAANMGLMMDEKPFSAHITLCRINKPGVSDEFIRKIKTLSQYEIGKIRVNNIEKN